ncbi:MAG: T9SS type A sorting domain-containing protein [Lentimicrobium sp.]
MKKKLLFCLFSIGFTLLTHAQQLQFSNWTRFDTYFNDTVFQHFSKNTCTNSTSEGLLVSSTYTEEGNVFTIQDVSGPAACSPSIIGTYTFIIINGTSLRFTLVSDACTGRANSLTEGIFTRMPPKTIHIPAQFSHIQDGIEAADNTDTVLVEPGTYYENINFMGKKPLFVASRFIMDGDTNHIANTIINGSQPLDPDKGSVVTLESGEDTTSVLCGFTITGGTGRLIPDADNARSGGGVFISGSGGKLLNNHIQNNLVSNEGWAFGGGITAAGPDVPLSWVVLRNNRINNNQAISQNNGSDGGGFFCYYNLVLKDNQISYNSSDGNLGSDGGGVVVMGAFGPITIDISKNEITHNEAITTTGTTDYAALGGGISLLFDITGSVSNNTISSNSIDAPGTYRSWGPGAFIQDLSSDSFVFENNLIQQNYVITTQNCRGGGLSLLRSGGNYLNNVIQHNSASNGGGICIYNSGSNNDTVVLVNNTITGNTATYGGGIYTAMSNAVVINSIIVENNANLYPSIRVESGIIKVRYSDVAGDDVWPGDGNVNCHATFLGDGYHISDTCQLVEKGIASIFIDGFWYNCPAYDIDGEGRPSNAFPEIGADEVLLVSVPEPIPANSSAFNIYPNPTSGIITVEQNETFSGIEGEISIVSLTGKELLRQQVTGPKPEFNISALPAGVYFIKLIPDDQSAPAKVGKFVKK